MSKDVQHLHTEYYKTLLGEILKVFELKTIRSRDTSYSWVRRFCIVKIPILLKMIYTFNAVPIKIVVHLLKEIDRMILKFMCN